MSTTSVEIGRGKFHSGLKSVYTLSGLVFADDRSIQDSEDKVQHDALHKWHLLCHEYGLKFSVKLLNIYDVKGKVKIWDLN